VSPDRDIGSEGGRPTGPWRIFLIQHLLLALAGAVAGIAIGTALAPLMLRRTAEALNTTTAAPFDPLLSLAILFGALVVVALFTWLPARRGARISAVQAIAAGAGFVVRPSLLARLHCAAGCPRSSRWDSGRLRPALANDDDLALVLTTVTFISPSGRRETIDGILNDPALEGDVFDVAVFRPN
jgi:hypothetical protein